MSRDILSTSTILDETSRVVLHVAGPWLGVLWLTAAPLRLLQVLYLQRVLGFGPQVERYQDYLLGLAWLTTAALVLSLWGRLVFLRAVQLRADGGEPGAAAWRVPLVQLGSYAICALLLELAFLLTFWLILPLLPLVLLAGLAAAAAGRLERLSPWQLGGMIFASLGNLTITVGLPTIYLVAAVICWVNLNFLMMAGLWLAQGLTGDPLYTWALLLRPAIEGVPLAPAEPLVALFLLVLTWLILEPFWLTSLFLAVRGRQWRQTGEDLRRWFHRLRREEP